MLQLLELLEKALAPLALLAGILFALAQTAKIVLSLAQTDEVPRILKLPEEMWQKIERTIGYWLWLALFAVLASAAWVIYVLHLGPARGWVFISILIPGIVATGILGIKPLPFDKPNPPRWLRWTELIGFSYVLVAMAVLGFHSLDQTRTDLKVSCELQSGGTLAGAVVDSNARCVDYWLQRGIPASEGFVGEHPLLSVAAEGSDVRVLTLLLNTGHFDPNLPTADGDTPLHVAVRNGHPDMVCRLLAHGGLSHVPNRDFTTPLDEARALSDQDLAALIEGESCLPAE